MNLEQEKLEIELLTLKSICDNNTNMKEKLTRNIRCALCRKPMYYMGDSSYEPEVKLTIELPKFQDAVEIENMNSLIASITGIERCYIHVKCWNELPIKLHPSSLN